MWYELCHLLLFNEYEDATRIARMIVTVSISAVIIHTLCGDKQHTFVSPQVR